MTSAAPIAARIRIPPPSHSSRSRYGPVSDLPPRFTHARHTANVVAPPSVSSQQSPHVGRRHRAHGPTAVAPQCEHRADGGSPEDISDGIRANASLRRSTFRYARISRADAPPPRLWDLAGLGARPRYMASDVYCAAPIDNFSARARERATTASRAYGAYGTRAATSMVARSRRSRIGSRACSETRRRACRHR